MSRTTTRISRGYLPHRLLPRLQFVTVRLADSLPVECLRKWDARLAAAEGTERLRLLRLKRAVEVEQILDAGFGSCALADEQVAGMIVRALEHFDGIRYRLRAWVVMPNHVHFVIELTGAWTVHDVTGSWKRFTGREANRLLGRCGPFWQREYFDRAIRDDEHLRRAVGYVEANPLKAGLCRSVFEWKWSSARWRHGAGRFGALGEC